MTIIKGIAIALLILLIALPAFGRQIRIASWQIDHLRRYDSRGQNRRSMDDIKRLARYAALLDADVIALQGIEEQFGLSSIFPNLEYEHYFPSEKDNPKQAGFAVRRDITVDENRRFSLSALGGEYRRIYGTDISVIVDGQEIRMLSVHLQAGCWDDKVDPEKEECKILKQEMELIKKWINSVASKSIPFVIMGNFNRVFDTPGDKFWTEINDLSRVTERRKSNCWGGHYPPHYIDHIVLDKQATGWIVPDSFRQIVYDEGIDLKDRLSNHCPISVVIDIPSLTSVPSAPTSVRPVQ